MYICIYIYIYIYRNPISGQIMCDLPSGNNWNFDARWSPKLPAILATASFDGSVNVYSLTDTGSGTSGGAKQVYQVYRKCSLEFVLNRICSLQ